MNIRYIWGIKVRVIYVYLLNENTKELVAGLSIYK